ncbi:MAG TPA: porin [Geminicoccaceae bacterium]|nr:porin [Geminicoccaceae bacterium]
MRIIRQQQRQIDELSRRLDALTGQTEAPTERADQAGEQAATAAKTATEVADDSNFIFEWGPSPTITSKDGNWSVHLRGRLFVDGGYLDDKDGFYRNDNATEVRAARLGIEGTVWKDFDYRFEVDFADDGVEIQDAYIEYGGPPIEPARYIRVGQYKTPNSLEELTSSRFITFMERAAITDAFELNRRIGVGSGVGGDNWGVDAGLFGQNVDQQSDNEGFAAAGRGHYAFDLEALGRQSWFHVGSSVRFRDLKNDSNGDSVQYRQRPFFHFTGTRSVDTGVLADADNDVWLGGELAFVSGRFSAQSEAANTWLQRSGGNDDATGLWGGYLSASYFLTDDSRTYDAEDGVFDRVEVSDPVHEGGIGAWQLGARFDFVDLNDGSADVRGGEQYSTIVGVNWYLNNYIRMMLDGAWTRVFNARDSAAAASGSSNDIFGVGARAQVDW